MSWAAGYNNSVAYTTGFYQEQSPTWLKAALVMQRIAPPADGKFTYCELGFGQGLTSLILAATHPEGEFYACDFNPVHVVAASSIRDDAKLSNLTLLEKGTNRKLGNKDFKTKQSTAYGNSKLAINKSLVGVKKWTATEIEARGAELAKIAKKTSMKITPAPIATRTTSCVMGSWASRALMTEKPLGWRIEPDSQVVIGRRFGRISSPENRRRGKLTYRHSKG